MACPARFERATYTLEAGKMSLNNSRNDDIKVLGLVAESEPSAGIEWNSLDLGLRLQIAIRSDVKFIGLTDKTCPEMRGN